MTTDWNAVDDTKLEAIFSEAAELGQALTPVVSRGLRAVLTLAEHAATFTPALAEAKARQARLDAKADATEAAITARQAQADGDFATAQALRLSTITDLNTQIETQRVTLADLAGTLAEATATIERAAEIRREMKQKAGAL